MSAVPRLHRSCGAASSILRKLGSGVEKIRKLDADLETPTGTKGLFEFELQTYGKGGKVIILFAGAFNEMSSDIYAIVHYIASVLNHECLSFFGKNPAAS
jgi:hypothetical protein